MKRLVFFVATALAVFSATAYYPRDESHRQLDAAYAPASVSQTKDCPAGYTLSGKNCERINVSPSNLVCPPGTAPVNGQCLTFVPPTSVCPPGMQQAGNVCHSSHVTPASHQCHVGELDATGKMCQIVTEVPPVCPPGFQHSSSGDCSRASASALVCPAGHTLQGHSCIQSISTPANPTCEEDLTFDGFEACSKDVPIPPSCPQGFQMNGQECIKFHSLVPGPCPPGFESKGSQCVRLLEFIPSAVCPSTSSLSGNVCVQEIPVPPTCPSGTLASATGGCEKPVNKVPVCQEGTFMIHETIRGHGLKTPMCKQILKLEPSVVCPPTYTLMHGKCKKITLHPTAQKCTQGVLQQGSCSVHSAQVPVYECPADYQLTKGPKCVRNVSFDCSTTATTQHCEFPAYVSELMGTKQVSKGHYRALKEAAIAHGKEPVCRDVSRIVSKTCSRVETAPVQLVCPDGSRPDGHVCPSVSTFEADVFCPRGLLDQSTGQCVEMHVQSIKKVCPPDAHLEGKVCIHQQVQPASVVCPEGTEMGHDGRCFVRVAEVHHANKVLKQPAQMVCERGQMIHSKCVDSEVMPKDFICPQGTHDAGGKCVKTAPLIAPPPVTVTKAALYVCPDGRPASGKSCHSTLSVAADRMCHDGGELQGDRCVHYVQLIQSAPKISHVKATPVCPTGHTLQGKNCVLKVQETASVMCPAGFDMQETESGVRCATAHPMHEVCPPGTQKTAEGCLSKTIVPPQVTIVKQCTKGQAGC